VPRGRLIFPFLIELAQLDTEAMAADPDGDGPQTSGYDLDFREPVIITQSVDDVTGDPLRLERCTTFKCQIEDKEMEALRQVLGGTSPDSAITLVMHFKDLEKVGLVDDNGRATIRKNDRLAKIFNKKGKLIMVVPDPPGLYVTSATDAGFGIGPFRNLLIVKFDEREQGVQSSSR